MKEKTLDQALKGKSRQARHDSPYSRGVWYVDARAETVWVQFPHSIIRKPFSSLDDVKAVVPDDKKWQSL